MGVTIKQIAKELGVTAPTVSKALNDRPGISSELKAKVRMLAERLGYAPYINARSTGMYNQNIKTIAIICSRIGQHLAEQLRQGTDKIFYGHGYYELRYTIDKSNALITLDKENELVIKRLLLDKRILGVMFAFLEVSDMILAQFHKSGIPTVLLNNYTDYGKCVIINNYKIMYEVVETLLRLGHTKIGLIMCPASTEPVWTERFNAYKKCLMDHNIPYNPDIIVDEWTYKLENSEYATKKLITDHPEITAIVYGSDYQAYGGLKALREMNKRIPEDVAIIGFDDMAFNLVTIPPLSSVRQPIEQMGEIGASMLLKAINHKDFSHDVVELDATLNLRASCIKETTTK